MSSVVFNKQNVQSLVAHHIALLNRFGITEDNDFSVIYFSLKDKEEEELKAIFQTILRKTDALFPNKDSVVAMLPGTDWNGATVLLSGIQEFLNQPLVDNVVTYPYDGDTAEALLGKLAKIVKENSNVTLKF